MKLEGAAECQDRLDFRVRGQVWQHRAYPIGVRQFVKAGLGKIQHVNPRHTRLSEFIGDHLHYQRVHHGMQLSGVSAIDRQPSRGPSIWNSPARAPGIRRTHDGPQADRDPPRIHGQRLRDPTQSGMEYGKRPQPARDPR